MVAFCEKICEELKTQKNLPSKNMDKLKLFSSELCSKIQLMEMNEKDVLPHQIANLLLELNNNDLVSPVHKDIFKFLFSNHHPVQRMLQP